MNVPRMREWVAALRSGKYTQTTGQMVLTDDWKKGRRGQCSYCCLGVASVCTLPRRGFSEIFGPQTAEQAYWEANEAYPELIGFSAGYMLNRRVANRLGIARNQRRLASLNDGGMSFPGIADLIEADIQRYLNGEPLQVVD